MRHGRTDVHVRTDHCMIRYLVHVQSLGLLIACWCRALCSDVTMIASDFISFHARSLQEERMERERQKKIMQELRQNITGALAYKLSIQIVALWMNSLAAIHPVVG